MENAQKRIAADGESKLPEEIIQHIQSLMSERDAALTTLVSKSWHGAWCIRPNLYFDPLPFRHRMDEFPIFARKSMQRYEDLNLKIKSFKLWVEGDDDSDLARELILKAIKLGATDLTIDVPTWVSINLPYEVLESETLTRLSVQNVRVDFRKSNKVVNSSNLKSLHLSNVYVNGDLIRNLISRCPSIEELTLRRLRRSTLPVYEDPMIDLHKLIELHKLKYLRLDSLGIADSLSKRDLWPQFACLKELVIWDYLVFDHSDWEKIRICSPSLERITIHLNRITKDIYAVFDVPNIRYFKFVGCEFPCLIRFKAMGSREWESDIHIHRLATSASWFASLKRFVRMLSPSRVSLSIFIGNRQYDGYSYVGDGSAIPAVENLTLEGFGVTRAFMDDLLLSCCPKFINIQKHYAKVVDLKVFRQLKKKRLLDAPRKRNHREILHFQRK